MTFIRVHDNKSQQSFTIVELTFNMIVQATPGVRASEEPLGAIHVGATGRHECHVLAHIARQRMQRLPREKDRKQCSEPK